METKKEELELNVAVSGHTVFKAVSNYLRNSDEFKQAIQAKVDAAIDSDTMELAIRRRVDNAFSSWDMKDAVNRAIKKAIEEHVKEYLKTKLKSTDLEKTMKKLFSDMLVNK